MSLLSPERIEEAAPQVRTFLRKVATVDTEHWIRQGLPRVNGLPPADVLARQVVALRDAVRGYLSGQEARYVQYVREHPPELRPVDEGALAALPPEAVLTYHMWLEDLVGATEETDKQTFTQLIRAHLREAIGTGGEAARRQSGALAPGFGTLTQKEAAALDRRTTPAPVWADVSTHAYRRALADRAQHKAVQGAALRDGAGRVVAAATFSTRGETLTVRHLGALETVVPGAGLHMLRELAGLAASKGKGLTLTAPAESAPALREIGLVENGDGRFTISAHSALALAQSAPGPSAAWTRAGWSEGPEATSVTKAEETPLPEWARGGWLEGPARTFAEVTGDTAALEAELAATWPTATANFGQAQAAIANFRSLAQNVAAGNITAEEAAAMHLYVLRGKDGYVDAVALVREVAGEALYGDRFGARVGRTGAGREMMRRLCGLESAKKHGFRLNSTSAAEGFYERLGMTQLRPAQGWTGAEYFFTPQQAQQFATGLTRGATFVGQITWELAVAGAAEYFENIIIPGVVDTVSATTHKQLVAALAEGLARGEGTNDLIARIRALDDTTFSMVRAERIARTEVITANRAGAYQIGLEAGGTQKRWVSRLMPNTRDWHREAHGQVVPYKQPFVVANGHGVPEHLMFPGDRSLGASADNTIQCVCSMLTLKPGVSDDATYNEYGAAGGPAGPGPVAAIAPEPVRKADVISLDDLREFVAKDKGWAPGPNAGWKRRDSGSTAVAERPASTSYRIIHQPRKESGARADDLSLVRADVYEHPEWYGGDEYPEMVPIVEAMRGNPDMRLTVYRAVPIEGTGPNYGDWVTPVRHYAELHGEILAGMGEAAEGETFKILEKEVAVRDLVWPGDYLPEFGWFPERVQKDKGWMPGPNAGWKRKDEVEPEARVPEHLRDRVASSLNSMNLLIRPEWEAVMTDRGLSEDAIVEANRLLNAWGSNKAQQERAAAEILEHLAHKDEVARTIQAASQLEEDAWAIWTEAHPDASAFIYRKGSALTKDIEAWTRNYHGAWMGNAGHIGWDAQLPFTLEAIHSKGYSILAGVNRGVGAPGEQEITLIRTEHLYPGTDVRKDKGWAPGPNAMWRRLDEGEPWLKPTRAAEKGDQHPGAPCSGYQLDKAVVTQLADHLEETLGVTASAPDPDALEMDGMIGLEAWRRDFKAMVQTNLTERLVDDEDFLAVCGLQPGDFSYEDYATRKAIVAANVRDLVDTWATTSGDSNLKALLIQEAARQEFGLTDVRTKDLLAIAQENDALNYYDDPHLWTTAQYVRYTTTLESREFGGYRAFVRAQYDETQAMLEKHGITEVLLYRGGSVPEGTIPGGLPEEHEDCWAAGRVRLRQNPLTSWSTDSGAASMFVDSFTLTREAAMFAAVIPAERILATPATGNGCLTEAEAVILGGETEAFAIVKGGGQRVYIHEALEADAAGTLGKHQLTTSDLTEGAGYDKR